MMQAEILEQIEAARRHLKAIVHAAPWLDNQHQAGLIVEAYGKLLCASECYTGCSGTKVLDNTHGVRETVGEGTPSADGLIQLD